MSTPASSKPKFRSRKLDYKRPLPICQAVDLPDLDEEAHRAVPVVATGVEKEEEEEHHLQAVISAAQVSDAAPNVYIPTPDASRLIDYYSDLYNRQFKRPTSYIRFSATVEECIGCSYCMDDFDVDWLKEFNGRHDGSVITELEFEQVITELEKIAGDGQKNNPEFMPCLEDLESFVLIASPSTNLKNAIPVIFEYWKNKRSQKGLPLIQPLKFEEATKGEIDPYICFRRREIRTTRKTRRADSQSIQKLRQLRAEMETAKLMLEMISRRERMRKELLLLEHGIFEQKLLIKSSKISLGVEDAIYEEARLARKRLAKLRQHGNASVAGAVSSRPLKPISSRKRKNSQTEDDIAYKDPIIISVENDVKAYCLENSHVSDLTESGVAFSLHPASNYYSVVEDSLNRGIFDVDSALGNKDRRVRRRIGRGGRIIYDRARTRGLCHNFKYDSFAAPFGNEDFDKSDPYLDICTVVSLRIKQLTSREDT